MTVAAEPHTARRAHQRYVESLLADLDERRQSLYRLQAIGVRRAAMQGAKQELARVHERLRDAVANARGTYDAAAGSNR